MYHPSAPSLLIELLVVMVGSRIIEIEWAVENDRPFLPSPKKEYMVKGKVRSKRRNRGNATAKKGGSADDGSLASMLPPAGEDVDSGAYN
jgi:hypothetical protein